MQVLAGNATSDGFVRYRLLTTLILKYNAVLLCNYRYGAFHAGQGSTCAAGYSRRIRHVLGWANGTIF